MELTGDEKAARAQLRIEALERELVQRQDVVNRALQAHNDMRQRQAELLKDFEDEKQTTFAITADMTRQYKSMQEELMRRINTLESTIMEQKDQLELARQACSPCPKCETIVLHARQLGTMCMLSVLEGFVGAQTTCRQCLVRSMMLGFQISKCV